MSVCRGAVDDVDGAWTEVPSRKKLRAKKDAPELQENRTRNETVDTIQQVVINVD